MRIAIIFLVFLLFQNISNAKVTEWKDPKGRTWSYKKSPNESTSGYYFQAAVTDCAQKEGDGQWVIPTKSEVLEEWSRAGTPLESYFAIWSVQEKQDNYERCLFFKDSPDKCYRSGTNVEHVVCMKDPNLTEKDPRKTFSKFIAAIIDDKLEVVSKILESTPAHTVIYSEKTLLDYVAELGSARVAKLLLAKGAQVNFPSGEEHLTPLMRAAFQLNTKLVETLVRSGSDLNVKDDEGNTAINYLSLAATGVKTNDILAKPIPQKKDKIIAEAISILNELVRSGSNINSESAPFLDAVRSRRIFNEQGKQIEKFIWIPVVDEFLKLGADINIRNGAAAEKASDEMLTHLCNKKLENQDCDPRRKSGYESQSISFDPTGKRIFGTHITIESIDVDEHLKNVFTFKCKDEEGSRHTNADLFRCMGYFPQNSRVKLTFQNTTYKDVIRYANTNSCGESVPLCGRAEFYDIHFN